MVFKLNGEHLIQDAEFFSYCEVWLWRMDWLVERIWWWWLAEALCDDEGRL